MVFTDVSDTALDLIVRRIEVDHPNDDEVMMAGHLSRLGFTLPEHECGHLFIG